MDQLEQLPAGCSHRTVPGVHGALHVVEGPRQGPTLLLIPGQSMPWQSYLRVLPALCNHFHCLAMDVRGHGDSAFTPGHYRLSAMGDDAVAVLRALAQGPALVTGNSSGGLIALYAAAHAPALVAGVMPEDPPLFAAEWPELKTGYAHTLFGQVVEYLDRPHRDLAGFFGAFEVPVGKGQRVMRAPKMLVRLLAWAISRRQRSHPDQPVDLRWMPFQLRVFVYSLSRFDPAFTRAFWDGSACDVDHAQMLAQVKCPMHLLHADWFIHATAGLVGAMTDQQAARAVALAPGATYQRVRGGHVIHQEQPAQFVHMVETFAARCLPATRAPENA